jgi:aspartate racemase
VGVVAVPCNSAHHWYAQLSEHSRAPIIHIAQACVDRLQQPPGSRVMVLATRGALQSGFYQRALVQAGMVALQPDAPSQCWVDDCIRLIKAADLPGGGAALEQVLEHARALGVSALIMGCTEIPIAAQYAHAGEMVCADSSLALADAVVGYALQRRWHLAMRDAPHGTPS